MLIFLPCLISTTVAGILTEGTSVKKARQIPDQKFERFYNGVFADKDVRLHRYEELDDNYFDQLTSDYENNVEQETFSTEDSSQQVEDKRVAAETQDPVEVFSRLLFYISELPAVN